MIICNYRQLEWLNKRPAIRALSWVRYQNAHGSSQKRGGEINVLEPFGCWYYSSENNFTFLMFV